MQQARTDRHLTAFLWIVFGILGRLIPHPPNVSPMTSIALFGGSRLSPRSAFAITMATMVLSDVLLALAWGHRAFGLWSLFSYSGFALIVLAGQRLRSAPGAGRTLGYLAGSSVFYWIWTNFGIWATGDHGLYARTFEGLVSCYVAALPFLGNALVGDLAWGLALFVSFEAVRKLAPRYGIAVQGA